MIFFTTQCSSSALQGDLPGEGVSSGLFCFQLLLRARKHVPPQQQHLGKVIAHEGGTWAQTQCGFQIEREGHSIVDKSKVTDIGGVSRGLTESHEGPQQQPSCLCALQGQTTVLSSCPQEVFSYTHHQLQDKNTYIK